MYTCTCGQDFSNSDELKQHREIYSNRFHACAFCDEEILLKDMSCHLFHCGSIIIDKRLKWRTHLEHIEAKIALRIGLLRYLPRSAQDPNNKTMMNVFKSIVRTVITDDQTIWDRLQIMQSKAIGAALELVYTSAENLQNNSFKKEIVTKLLHTRTSNIRDSLSKQYYPTEVEHVVDKLQFNVILIGSLRVGKSQLINALCGQGIAEISPGLNSCSKKIKCYTLQDYQQLTSEIKPFQINFFHTPSI
ncbi:unnamed protein product [Adineta ricciae]|uniref:G domain-containing protein n=1 Tax=Adineta ricciae TaxID=249248 RepID=A0A815DER6_ADIRI|nr:unnamed protein product [Adineta ricciae]